MASSEWRVIFHSPFAIRHSPFAIRQTAKKSPPFQMEQFMTGVLRAAIAGMACLLSLAAGLAPASAADYPNHPVRWLIGFAPGGPVDIVARIMRQWLSDRFGQQFVGEN